MKLQAEEDDPALRKWLTEHNTFYTSPKSQNDILSIMANAIIQSTAAEIKALPVFQFSVIVDVSADEQESVCLRYVDHDLVPHEELVGLYRVSETSGHSKGGCLCLVEA